MPDVQEIVRNLTELQVQFAVRSGGHMASPLAANINDGVLIDMADLSEVTYDPSSSTVTVGSGNRWGDVYAALDPYNITVAGGRIVDVGVAGLTLGGMSTQAHDLVVPWFDFHEDADIEQTQAVFRITRISTALCATTWLSMKYIYPHTPF